MGFRQGMPLQRAWKASERRFPLQCRLEHAPYFYCDPKTETEQTKGIVLSSFFVRYMLTQVIGGRLSSFARPQPWPASVWKQLFINRIEQLEAAGLANDVAPFLEHREEAALLTAENIKAAIISSGSV